MILSFLLRLSTIYKVIINIYNIHKLLKFLKQLSGKCILIFFHNFPKINFIRHFVCSTFCPFDILSVRHFVRSTFCLFDILSVRHFVCSTFCPVRHFVCRHFVRSTFCLSTLCPSAFCLSTLCLHTLRSCTSKPWETTTARVCLGRLQGAKTMWLRG